MLYGYIQYAFPFLSERSGTVNQGIFRSSHRDCEAASNKTDIQRMFFSQSTSSSMRKVWFAPSHRVLVIPRLPKDLKSTLFYSKEEIRHLRSIERIRSQGVMSTLSRYGFGFAKIATRRKLLSEREGRRKRSRAQDDSGLVVTSAYARSQALKERPHFF